MVETTTESEHTIDSTTPELEKPIKLTATVTIFVKSTFTYGGYDSGGGAPNTCGRPYRAGRMHKPPCNLALEGGFCKDAGESYPWHAVKRFVKENRGLMRRMYGEQSEGFLIREELARTSPENVRDRFPRQQQTLDIDNELYTDDDEEELEDSYHAENYIKHEYELKFEGRFMRDEDVLRTKFIYSDKPTISIKLAGLKTAPHFRKASTTVATTTTSNNIFSREDTSGTGTISISDTSTDSAVKTSTFGGDTNFPSETSKTDSENSTIPSLREVEEMVETTTESEYTIDITTPELEKTTKLTATVADSSESTDKIEDDKKPYGPSSTAKTTANAGVLFQDAEEEASEQNKIKLNYKLAGVNACPVKEEVVAPFWANNTRGEVLALLNMYPFEQYVHWEKCSFENKQMYCREGCRCEQQYRLHRLLAYDPQNECKGIFSDWFRFPSCCVCKCYGLPSEFRVTSRSPRNGEAQWFAEGTED
ncbi:hypothetical protein WA026_001991 [Henosepilachna vigintioctopunctata]|uniref:Spaetzle domain-containing protein n=1 Tax=Henosepilachna vigintioctopunctata TaxID=420089 RepID=A0AAW1UJK3_9CUCU